jgi:hypothetical protein
MLRLIRYYHCEVGGSKPGRNAWRDNEDRFRKGRKVDKQDSAARDASRDPINTAHEIEWRHT